MERTERHNTAASRRTRFDAVVAWVDQSAPRPFRGPFTRWPRTADGILAAVVWAVSVLLVTVSQLEDDEPLRGADLLDHPTAIFVLLGVSAGALAWRRSAPIVVTAVVLLVTIVWSLLGYGDGHDLPLVISMYTVGRTGVDARLGLSTLLTAAIVSIVATLVDADQNIDVLPALLLTVGPWYVGRQVWRRDAYVTLLAERGDRLEAEQLARARQAVAEERTRIARELHDVVAHQVSVMTIQAGAARVSIDDDPAGAAEAMGDVERAGRRALEELRHLLGVLRPDRDDRADHPDAELGPRRGLSSLDDLTAVLVDVHAQVTVTFDDVPADLPTAVDVSAYRIIREAVTNIVKHAGSAPDVDIRISTVDGALEISVVNSVDRDATNEPLATSGYGIVGMRERAALLGGHLVAEPLGPRRFRVAARLPLETEPT